MLCDHQKGQSAICNTVKKAEVRRYCATQQQWGRGKGQPFVLTLLLQGSITHSFTRFHFYFYRSPYPNQFARPFFSFPTSQPSFSRVLPAHSASSGFIYPFLTLQRSCCALLLQNVCRSLSFSTAHIRSSSFSTLHCTLTLLTGPILVTRPAIFQLSTFVT